MTDNVIYPNFWTKLDISPDRVLQAALDAGLEDVIIIGTSKDGEDYFASSLGDMPQVIWNVEFFKKRLMEGFQ